MSDREKVLTMAQNAKDFDYGYDYELLVKIADVIDDERYRDINGLLLEMARYINNY